MQRLIEDPELRERLGKRALVRSADFAAEAFYAPFDPATGVAEAAPADCA
jgi:hypothetical protein